ncbi:MAG: shikimate kinase [Candidatus Omnitrophica bacterium]|jgi:shikimate kinase|nr:shikimate kinase [Candidatus Omnitrophota bacterium]
MKNIILIGFMGTGKTAVAKAIAKSLAMKYVSTDELIEKKEGRTIAEIFSSSGEAYFRMIEKKVVEEISRVPGQVVDTGGGVVLDHDNIENLKKGGTVICLWASPETVYRRTASCRHRPLLNVEDPMRRIRELLEYRTPFYHKADHHIHTDADSIESVARKAEEIANGKKSDSRETK